MTATERPAPSLPAEQAVFRPKLRDRALQLGWSFIGGHVGVLSAVAFYFLVTQNSVVKPHWDGLFPYAWWPDIRHLVRGLLEGIYGGSLVRIALANPLKKTKAKPGLADRAMVALKVFPNRWQGHRVTPLQLILSPVTVFLASLPGIIAESLVFFGIPWAEHRAGVHLHLLVSHLAHHHVPPGVVGQGENVWDKEWPPKLIGLAGMFFYGGRVLLKIGSDVQEFLAERRAIRYGRYDLAWKHLGRVRRWLLAEPHWPLPPAYRALFWSVVKSGRRVPEHGKVLTVCMLLATPLLAAGTVYGWVILKRAGG